MPLVRAQLLIDILSSNFVPLTCKLHSRNRIYIPSRQMDLFRTIVSPHFLEGFTLIIIVLNLNLINLRILMNLPPKINLPPLITNPNPTIENISKSYESLIRERPYSEV
jgi:hypothetical protein